ncbi:MAG: hypothetical protein GX626_05765 [Spirochaetales bacterium]|nr:hypothetical protein [Spirochaetales bacterium]
MLKLYVDADSCPKNLRQVVLRAIQKKNLVSFFVADRPLKDIEIAYQEHTTELRKAAKAAGESDEMALRAMKSPISMVIVKPGMDSADNWIVENATPPAIAITHDIPLASRLVEKGLTVLDDRGKTYTRENMAQRLSVRNAMTEFREMGLFAEKHERMGNKQIKAFSDAFDSLLTAMLKQ